MRSSSTTTLSNKLTSQHHMTQGEGHDFSFLLLCLPKLIRPLEALFSVCLSGCLSVCLPLYLSICLSFGIAPSIDQRIEGNIYYVSSVWLSVHPANQSLTILANPSVHRSIHPNHSPFRTSLKFGVCIERRCGQTLITQQRFRCQHFVSQRPRKRNILEKKKFLWNSLWFAHLTPDVVVLFASVVLTSTASESVV